LPQLNVLFSPIDPSSSTIGDIFQQAGYATSCFGKWHLGWGNLESNDWQMPLTSGPNDVGFDYYWGLPNVNSGSPYVLVENNMIVGYEESDPLIYGKKPASPTDQFPRSASHKVANKFGGALKAHALYKDEAMGSMMVEKSTQWIEEHKDKPFFMYFATTHIHHPFTPAERFKGSSEIGLYGDYIHELDWMVGELMNKLKELGLEENTLILFSSDNGGMMNLGGRTAARAGHKINGDLLGFKFGSWEGGHRIPFIAKWPGKIPAGSQSSQLISMVDMYATIAAITGQQASMEGKDSINMLPALIDESITPLRTELLTPGRNAVALRDGKWLYLPIQGSGGFTGKKEFHHAWGGPAAVALVNGVNNDIQDGDFIEGAPKHQLYNMEIDFNQTQNIVNEYPEVAKRMKQKLKAQLLSLNP